MELWIRSQDKLMLVKVNYFYIMEQNSYCAIVGETIDSGPIIARYNSKERALEVLDEIQKLITPQIIMREMKSTGLIENGMSDGTLYIKNEPIVQIIDPIVYEMPKE